MASRSSTWKPKPLPWWRKTIAALCGAGALAIFWIAAKHTDLTALVGGGALSQEGWQALGLYGVFIALLFGCIAAVGRRSKPLTFIQTPLQQRRLSKRTRLAAALILLCIPVTLYDERCTTVMAHMYLRESGIKTKNHRATVDSLAAQIILQDYMDMMKNKKSNEKKG